MTSRTTFLAFLAGVVATATAYSQAMVFNVKTAHQVYVIGEPVAVTVKMANKGVKPVVIDDYELFKDNDLYFKITNKNGATLKKMRQGKIVPELSLEQDQATAIEVNLSDWYALLEPGNYRANVVLINNGLRFESPAVLFEVVPGMPLATTTQYIMGDKPIERTLSVVYWPREEREVAFLRAFDSNGAIWRTLVLGSVMRVKNTSIEKNGDTSFYVYRQASRDTLVRTEIVSDVNGVKMVDNRRAIESVSSPMVDGLREAIERDARKKAK